MDVVIEVPRIEVSIKSTFDVPKKDEEKTSE